MRKTDFQNNSEKRYKGDKIGLHPSFEDGIDKDLRKSAQEQITEEEPHFSELAILSSCYPD